MTRLRLSRCPHNKLDFDDSRITNLTPMGEVSPMSRRSRPVDSGIIHSTPNLLQTQRG